MDEGTTDVDTIGTDADAAEVEEDKVELLKSGRILLVIDGRRYTMRRPRLGELREYREALDGLKDLPLEEQKGQRGNDHIIDLVALALERFGDKRLPDDRDDLAPWLGNPALPARFINHWQSVPLDPGSNADPITAAMAALSR